MSQLIEISINCVRLLSQALYFFLYSPRTPEEDSAEKISFLPRGGGGGGGELLACACFPLFGTIRGVQVFAFRYPLTTDVHKQFKRPFIFRKNIQVCPFELERRRNRVSFCVMMLTMTVYFSNGDARLPHRMHFRSRFYSRLVVIDDRFHRKLVALPRFPYAVPSVCVLLDHERKCFVGSDFRIWRNSLIERRISRSDTIAQAFGR